MPETVAAVVVTYNRKELLRQCLDGILEQTRPVDRLIIVDNHSIDGTPELLRQLSFIPEPNEAVDEPAELNHVIRPKRGRDGEIKVSYVRMDENTGGAGGFHEGMKRAYAMGCDWIWLTDDDVEPEMDALRKLLSEAQSKRMLVVQPGRYDVEASRKRFKHRYNKFWLKAKLIDEFSARENTTGGVVDDLASVCFEGVLLNRVVVSNVGLPDSNFFTFGDDTEYGLRVSTFTRIHYAPRIVIRKLVKENAQIKRWLFLTSNRIPFGGYWKQYYALRNLFLLNDHLYRSKLVEFVVIPSRVLKHMLAILLFDDQKRKRLALVVKAFKDGIHHRYGKVDLHI